MSRPGVYRNTAVYTDLGCQYVGLVALKQEDDMGYAYATHHCTSGCEEPHIEEHSDECECDLCHDNHAGEYGMHVTDGVCSRCTDEIEDNIRAGSWCLIHRRQFIDLENTICNVCEEEQYVENLLYNSAEKGIISFDGAAEMLIEYFMQPASMRGVSK